MKIAKLFGLVFVPAALSAMPLQAEELPFYKAGTSAPAARTAASTATSTTAAPIDSRTVQSADSAEVKFDSSGAPGVLLIVR